MILRATHDSIKIELANQMNSPMPLSDVSNEHVMITIAGKFLKRIWNNAKAIANSMMEDLDESDRLVIDLAAVLHDVDDHKYKKEGQDYLGDFFKVRKSVCCQ